MELIIKFKDSAQGRVLLLCQYDGTPLPCQMKSVLESKHDSLSEFTVTFRVDRIQIKIAEGKP